MSLLFIFKHYGIEERAFFGSKWNFNLGMNTTFPDVKYLNCFSYLWNRKSCCMTHVKWDFSYMYASVSVPQRQNERQTKANSSTKVHLVKPMSELRLLLKWIWAGVTYRSRGLSKPDISSKILYYCGCYIPGTLYHLKTARQDR